VAAAVSNGGKMNALLRQELEATFKDISVSIPEDTRLIINAKREQVLTILRFLRDKGYDHLALISCVDWLEEGELELVYIISSYLKADNEYTGREKINIILKTRILRENPQFVTVIPVFENAEPYEREIHELFGVDFQGHPRLTPLFLEREYKIPPFRKDFDTRKYVEEVFDKIPFVDEKK
jgi:NADH-quinone oxidoreductase subunit C